MSVCRECSRPVIWAKSINDIAMPLDKQPTLGGNIRLLAGIAHKVPASQLPIEDADAYTCHLDTCSRPRNPVPTSSKPRCQACAQVMDPLISPDQTRHPTC